MFHFPRQEKTHGNAASERRFLYVHQEHEQPEADGRAGPLERIRDEHKAYFFLLKNYLNDRGITLKPVYTTAASYVQSPYSRYATVYLFDVGKQVFALLCRDDYALERGLWRIDANQAACLRGLHHRILLAAGTDGQVIYALTGNGKLLVMDPNGEGTIVEGAQVIDPLSYCLKAAEDILPEKQIADRIAALCSGGIVEISDTDSRIFYDPEAQYFFRMDVDGNFYHGYDVDYYPMSRAEVIAYHTGSHNFSIKRAVDACRRGFVPEIVLLARLPFREGPYSPPSDFGYGKYFI